MADPDDLTPFERWYNRTFRTRGADTKHMNDCEAAWNAAAPLTPQPGPEDAAVLDHYLQMIRDDEFDLAPDGEPENARAAVLARMAGKVPTGWKLVPVVPTDEMLNAAIDAHGLKLGCIAPLGFRMSPQMMFEKSYAAMLAAAPEAPR